jgi:hypothetical protein
MEIILNKTTRTTQPMQMKYLCYQKMSQCPHFLYYLPVFLKNGMIFIYQLCTVNMEREVENIVQPVLFVGQLIFLLTKDFLLNVDHLSSLFSTVIEGFFFHVVNIIALK